MNICMLMMKLNCYLYSGMAEEDQGKYVTVSVNKVLEKGKQHLPYEKETRTLDQITVIKSL